MLASLFRRQPIKTPDATSETAQPDGSTILMRFLTAGGAEVHVAYRGIYTENTFSGTPYGEKDHSWTCHGCDEHTDRRHHFTLTEARRDANDHATVCRAMPKPTAA
ncbi:hypothetical protein OV320_2663 [Actinobacteria bacterium OV320]|nr:hypothetical protein OV320_2663 [Actinobacteria bacterium OV320]